VICGPSKGDQQTREPRASDSLWPQTASANGCPGCKDGMTMIMQGSVGEGRAKERTPGHSQLARQAAPPQQRGCKDTQGTKGPAAGQGARQASNSSRDRPLCSMDGVAMTTQAPTPSSARALATCCTCRNTKGLAACARGRRRPGVGRLRERPAGAQGRGRARAAAAAHACVVRERLGPPAASPSYFCMHITCMHMSEICLAHYPHIAVAWRRMSTTGVQSGCALRRQHHKVFQQERAGRAAYKPTYYFMAPCP